MDAVVKDLKACTVCKIGKVLSDFGPRLRGKNGLNSSCRLCVNTKRHVYRVSNPQKGSSAFKKWYHKDVEKSRERLRRWRRENPDKSKAVYRRSYLKRYDLTPEAFDSMLKAQGGVCLVCQSLNGGKALCVDHDHESGHIRDLLCDRCNTVLGLVRENPMLIRSMLLYLVRHGKLQKKEATKIC